MFIVISMNDTRCVYWIFSIKHKYKLKILHIQFTFFGDAMTLMIDKRYLYRFIWNAYRHSIHLFWGNPKSKYYCINNIIECPSKTYLSHKPFYTMIQCSSPNQIYLSYRDHRITLHFMCMKGIVPMKHNYFSSCRASTRCPHWKLGFQK